MPPTAPSPVVSPVASPVNSAPQGKGKMLLVIGIIAVLVLGGAGAFAFIKNIGPFARAPYGESNLMSGMLAKFADIDSASYKVSAALFAEPREADAKPFNIEITDDKTLKEKYYRDYQRSQDVEGLLSTLRYSFPDGYPATIADVRNGMEFYQSRNSSVNDPSTKAPYSYAVTDGGKDFALTVNFETREAISMIRVYSSYYGTSTTIISGQKVTFTKQSYSPYLSIEPPKTLMEKFGEYSQYIPPEINIKGSVNAVAAMTQDGNPTEWKFGLDGSGDFGDLTYKLNIEALKNDQDYFVRINNIPSFFGGFLPPKGQWIIFSPKTDVEEEDSFSYAPLTSEDIGEMEKNYAERKAGAIDFLKKVTAAADEEKLFSFKNPPVKEKEGNRMLYRYDLKIRKEAVLPFYKKMMAAAEGNKVAEDSFFSDEGYLNYLESQQFSETFDYYDKNTAIAIWVDQDGFPAGMQYSIRIVPVDEAAALKDKQIKLEFKLSIDDINKPVNIDAPEGAKTYEEAMGEAKGYSGMEGYETQSALNNLRPEAEITYDASGGTYGKSAFALGPCTKKSGTLFGEERIFTSIMKAADDDASKATCVSTLDSFAVSVPDPEDGDYSYCVDSSGRSQKILGAITSAACR